VIGAAFGGEGGEVEVVRVQGGTERRGDKGLMGDGHEDL